MKRQHLINSLNTAINALEKDLIYYEWQDRNSCNCGVVAQAVLDMDSEQLETASRSTFKNLKAIVGNERPLTWKNAVKHTCSVTGKTNQSIFNKLFEKGLRPEDLNHLEYLSDPVILKNSGIGIKNTFLTLFVTPYYAKKLNLIKYLKSWVNILSADDLYITSVNSKKELQEELIRVVADENYERASELRELINA